MEIFISWSGPKSKAVAVALRDWLPKIINALKPWLSASDIDRGARWRTDIASRLETARAGIICLTAGNLHSDWILFEAGALSKTQQNTHVCTFLVDLEPADVKDPLAQFQATKANKDEVLELLRTLNKALAENSLPPTHIEEALEVWWPKLQKQLNELPPEITAPSARREDRELLEEILLFLRNQNRPVFERVAYQEESPVSVALRRAARAVFKLLPGSQIRAASAEEMSLPPPPDWTVVLVEGISGTRFTFQIPIFAPPNLIEEMATKKTEEFLIERSKQVSQD